MSQRMRREHGEAEFSEEVYPVLYEVDKGIVWSIDLGALAHLAGMAPDLWLLEPDEIGIVRLWFYLARKGAYYRVDVLVPRDWSKKEIDEYINHIWAIAEMVV